MFGKLGLIGLIVLSIFSIASQAIAIQAMNSDGNKKYKEEHYTSFQFVVLLLIISILTLLGGIGSFVKGLTPLGMASSFV